MTTFALPEAPAKDSRVRDKHGRVWTSDGTWWWTNAGDKPMNAGWLTLLELGSPLELLVDTYDVVLTMTVNGTEKSHHAQIGVTRGQVEEHLSEELAMYFEDDLAVREVKYTFGELLYVRTDQHTVEYTVTLRG